LTASPLSVAATAGMVHPVFEGLSWLGGQGLVWLAYLSLITGLVLTFYFPRRRFWARYENGKLQLAMLADRYVDAEREFGRLVDDISARTGAVAQRSSANS